MQKHNTRVIQKHNIRVLLIIPMEKWGQSEKWMYKNTMEVFGTKKGAT